MAFKPRLEAPSESNPYWISTAYGGYNKCMIISGKSVLPNCVGYAWGRFAEILGEKSCSLSTHDAKLWYGNTADGYKRGSEPALGAVICWSHPEYGHVAIVEEIHEDSITISQSAWSATGGRRWYTSTVPRAGGTWKFGQRFTFQGFIYNPKAGEGNGGGSDEDGNEDGIPTVDPKSLIDATAITPYIASPSYKTVDIDYKRLVKSGVVGVMFYGGSYFNDNHEVKKRYNPANLSKQVAGANKAKMPYGLHVKVRARTVKEARAECNSLYYVISNYPPELGLWLELELVKNKSKNNKIIETYYNYIYQWGLKDKCGFYVTRQQLSYISWDKFYDDFLLWLISPVKDIKDVDGQLLDPEFFMLDK